MSYLVKLVNRIMLHTSISLLVSINIKCNEEYVFQMFLDVREI